MPADVIQANYEALGSVAIRFQQQAETIGQMMQRVNQAVDCLRNGGWQGRGVDSFIGEVDDEIAPATKRLGQALSEAQQITLRASITMQTAEANAARLFSGQDDPIAVGLPVPLPGSTDQWQIGPRAMEEAKRGGTHARSDVEPDDFKSLYRFLESTPEGFPVQIARLPNGEYLIGLQGTKGGLTDRGAWFDPQSNTWLSNLLSGSGHESPYTRRIMEIIKTEIPEGSTINLAGASQGGHAAQIVGYLLAEEDTYKVGSVTSFAAYQVVPRHPNIGQAHTFVFNSDILNLVDKTEDVGNYLPVNPVGIWRNSMLPPETTIPNTSGNSPFALHNDYEHATYPGGVSFPFATGGGSMQVISYQSPDTIWSEIVEKLVPVQGIL